MNSHKNARLTLRRRQELVARLEAGEAVKRLARGLDVSVATVRNWRDRYRAAGAAGLCDRSSRPHGSPTATPARLQLGAKVLRWQRWTCAQIAGAPGVSAATAARILRRSGLRRRGRLEPPRIVQRYEHADVGGMVHVDIKTLGRIAYLGHRATGDALAERLAVLMNDQSLRHRIGEQAARKAKGRHSLESMGSGLGAVLDRYLPDGGRLAGTFKPDLTTGGSGAHHCG